MINCLMGPNVIGVNKEREKQLRKGGVIDLERGVEEDFTGEVMFLHWTLKDEWRFAGGI